MTIERKTAGAAGTMKAGDRIADAIDLSGLTRAPTIEACDDNASTVAELVAANETARADHATGRTHALIEGDAAVDAHDAAAGALQRQAERLQAVAAAISARREELHQQARDAAADAAEDAAEKLQDEGVRILVELDRLADLYAANLDRLRAIHAGIRDHNRIAARAGRSGLSLPHFVAVEPDTIEEVERVEVTTGPTITDVQGRRVMGFDQHGGHVANRAAVPATTTTTHIERIRHRGRRARDMTVAEIELPSALDDRAWTVRQS